MKKLVYFFTFAFLCVTFWSSVGCNAIKKIMHPAGGTVAATKVKHPGIDDSGGESGSSGGDSGGIEVGSETIKKLGSGEKFQPQMQQQQQQFRKSSAVKKGRQKKKSGTFAKVVKPLKKIITGSSQPDNDDNIASASIIAESKHIAGAAASLDTIEKNASLGVFCPPKMALYETRLITVKLDFNKTQAQVKREIVGIEKISNDWKSESDSSSVIAFSLNVYDSVRVSIKYDTTDFIISPAVGDIGRYTKVDVKNGNLWQWSIEAVSKNKRSSKITLVVDAHTPENLDLPPIPSHVIPITIYFDFGDMIRGWVRYLGENAQYTIPSVLVPIIVVIYKRRKKKNGKGEDKDKS